MTQQTKDPGNSEKTKQDKCPKCASKHTIFQTIQIKGKGKILKETREKNT